MSLKCIILERNKKKRWSDNYFADKKKHAIQNVAVSQTKITKLCGYNRFHCHLQASMLTSHTDVNFNKYSNVFFFQQSSSKNHIQVSNRSLKAGAPLVKTIAS